MEPSDRRPIFAALFSALAYLAGAGLAWTCFPGAYSPVNHWLSDLGSRALNPQGATFYNAGILLTALGLLAFFLSLGTLRAGARRVQTVMLTLTQGFGALGCLCMALTACFPIDHADLHSLFSAGLYIGLGTGFAFSVAALRYRPGFPRALLGLGVLTTAVDLVTSVALNTIPIFEWITVALFILYAIGVGIGLLGPRGK